MWEEGDKVEIRVPLRQAGLYGHLHRAQGTVEFVNPNTGSVHVDLHAGGTACVDPRWLYPVRKKGRKS